MNDYNQYIQDTSGPWDAPLRNYDKEPRPITIIVWNIKRDCIEHEYQVDYSKFDDRKFIGRLTYWAVRNGRSVETMSVEDWKRIK